MTLTGPGGIGKTSLAIELARRARPRFPDGAWFVSLDALDDPARSGPRSRRRSGSSTVRAAGRDRHCRRSWPTGRCCWSSTTSSTSSTRPDDVAAVVHASPGVAVIVTSRAPLRIAGEQEYPVRPLATGCDAGTTSPRRRAVRRSRPGRPSRLGAGRGPRGHRRDLPLLDGLPLGIELAAARVSLLPPAGSATGSLPACRCPDRGPRDAPARQRTLEGAIAWSHDLLEPGSAGTAPSAWRSSRAASISSRSTSRRPVRRRSEAIARRPARARRPEPDRRGRPDRRRRRRTGSVRHAPDDPVVRLGPAGRRWPRDRRPESSRRGLSGTRRRRIASIGMAANIRMARSR